MTVTTTYAPLIYKPGAGSAPRAIDFEYRSASDIQVTHRPTVGLDAKLVQDVHYTLTGDGQVASGSITAIGDWPADDEFIIERISSRAQNAALPPDVELATRDIEAQLDTTKMAVQEQDDALRRALSVVPGQAAPKLDFSELNDGDILEYRGGALRKKDLSAFAGQYAAIGAEGQLVGVGGPLPDAVPALASAIANDAARFNAPYNQLMSDLAAGAAANPLWWIPRAQWAGVQDGTSIYDANVALQAMIDDLWNDYGGALVDFGGCKRVVGNVMLRSGIFLHGGPAHASATEADASRCTWYANEAGPIFDTPPEGAGKTSIEGAGIQGFLVDGNGVAGASGLLKRSGRKFWSINNSWADLDGSAIKDLTASAGKVNGTLYIIENFVQNCLKDNAALVAWEGVYDLGGSDGRIVGGEISSSLTLAPSASGFVAGIVIRNADWHFVGPLVEHSDTNWVFTGTNATRCRGTIKGDFSWQHNVLLDANTSGNTLDGDLKRTGQLTDATYNGAHDLGSRNKLSLFVTQYPDTGKKALYASYDGRSTDDPNNKNDHSEMRMSPNAATALFGQSSTYSGGVGPVRLGLIPVTGATPNVNGLSNVRKTDNATLTNLLGASHGQRISMTFQVDCTVQHSASIALNPPANKAFTAGETILLKWERDRWREEGSAIVNYGTVNLPAGGATVDAEARAAITEIKSILTKLGAAS